MLLRVLAAKIFFWGDQYYAPAYILNLLSYFKKIDLTGALGIKVMRRRSHNHTDS